MNSALESQLKSLTVLFYKEYFEQIKVKSAKNTKHVVNQILEFVVRFRRFSVKVTASWEQGSNVDVALDDVAIGAACFDTGTLQPTSDDFKLETETKKNYKYLRGSGSESEDTYCCKVSCNKAVS